MIKWEYFTMNWKVSLASINSVTYSEPTAESVIDIVDHVHCNSLPFVSVSDVLHWEQQTSPVLLVPLIYPY